MRPHVPKQGLLELTHNRSSKPRVRAKMRSPDAPQVGQSTAALPAPMVAGIGS
nr:hypothetical protein [Halovivax sp. KZCA124]